MVQHVTTGVFETSGVEVTKEHFGAIFPYGYFSNLNTIEDAYTQSGISVGAHRFFVSEIRNPDASDDVKNNLTTHIAASRESGVLNLVLVDKQYYQNQDHLRTNMARYEFKKFFKELSSEKFGELPDKVVIELGNESFANKFGGELVYPKLVEAFLDAAAAAISEGATGVDRFELNIQGGNKQYINKQIFDHLEAVGKLSLLSLVDGVVTHQLEEQAEDLKLGGLLDIQAFWEAKGFDFDMDVTAWNVGKPVDVSTGVHFQPYSSKYTADDVFTIDPTDYVNNDIGARQGVGTVSVFAQLVASGVDQMHIWGISRHSNTYVVDQDRNGFGDITHGGVALKLLSESVRGMKLLDGTYETVLDKNGEYRTVWAQDHSTEGYDSFVFEDDDKFVVFLTSDDINEDEGLRVTLKLSGLDGIQEVRADVIRTEISEDFQNLLSEYNISTDDPRIREFETPVELTRNVTIREGKFSHTFKQDYEIFRLTVWKNTEAENLDSNYLLCDDIPRAPLESSQMENQEPAALAGQMLDLLSDAGVDFDTQDQFSFTNDSALVLATDQESFAFLQEEFFAGADANWM